MKIIIENNHFGSEPGNDIIISEKEVRIVDKAIIPRKEYEKLLERVKLLEAGKCD